MKIEIISNSAINAVYFGLALEGYEFGFINKPCDIAEMLKEINKYNCLDKARNFFRETKQDTCEVYPFWPRAALLETATFFMDESTGAFNFEKYREYVCNLQNITTDERSEAFFQWVKNFPLILNDIANDKFFQQTNEKMKIFVRRLSTNICGQKNKLANKIHKLSGGVETGVSKITVIICPIKCVYSADYFLKNGEMFVLLGDFLPNSVVHEYMHIWVKPKIFKHKENILVRFENSNIADVDKSYFLYGDEAGFLNAFEEHIVRIASNLICLDENICLDNLILQESGKPIH